MGITPNYVAKRSAWSAVTFWRVVLSILIVPLIIMIFDIIVKKHDYIEFYDDYVIQHSGLLSKNQKKCAFLGVMSVSVSQTFWQRILNYGYVKVNMVGKWDISTEDIADPDGLESYLESKIVKSNQVNRIVVD